MGLYSNGLSPSLDHKAIQAEMVVPLQSMFTMRIQILDRGMSSPGVYDGTTGDMLGGPVGTVLFDSGPNGAFCQAIRLPTTVSFGDQAQSTQGMQFQCLIDPGLNAQSGLRVKVIDGGNDPSLMQWQYVINDSIDSSVAWGRIFECRALLS